MTTLLAIGGLSPVIGSNISGPVTIPSTALGVALTSTQGLLWLHLGTPVCTFDMQVSFDGGSTWTTPYSDLYTDVYVPPVKTRPANVFVSACSIDSEIGGIPRKFRIVWNFTAIVTLDVVLSSLEP